MLSRDRQTEVPIFLGYEGNTTVWMQDQDVGSGTTYQYRCLLRVLLDKLLCSSHLVTTSPCAFSICAEEEPVATFFTGQALCFLLGELACLLFGEARGGEGMVTVRDSDTWR